MLVMRAGSLYLLKSRKVFTMKSLTRFTRILVVLIMTCIPFYARAQSAKQSLKTGKEQYDRKEYDQAIISFTDAITLCDLGAKKLMSDAYYRRGNAYDKKGEYDKAIADYNNSLSFDVYNFDSQSARAFMYYKNGEYDKAIKAYKQEIYLESGNRDAYVRLIASLVRTQKFDETYKFADQFKTKGRGPNVYGSAQWIFFSYYLVAVANDIPTGKYSAALTNLNTSLERCTPKIEDGSQDMYINILVLKGYVLEKLYWKAEAIEVYNKALAMNKQQPDVKAALGRLIQSPIIVAAQTDKVVPANKIVAQADKMPPQIIITSPLVSRGLKVVQKTKLLRVSGKAVDESGIYTVMVNDVEATLDAAGNFTASIPLAIGNNAFVITATDTKMNEATYNFIVAREVDKITPAIVPVVPVAAQTLPDSKYYALIIGVQDYT
ncbi:MAG: tetratricopeptide repeat protein, partial [Sphingobacteriales bacterium]